MAWARTLNFVRPNTVNFENFSIIYIYTFHRNKLQSISPSPDLSTGGRSG